MESKELKKIDIIDCDFFADNIDKILYNILIESKISIRFYYYVINIDIIIFENKTLYEILKQKLESNVIVEIIMSKRSCQLFASDKYYKEWSKLNTYPNFKCRLYGSSHIKSPVLHIKNIIIDDFTLISNVVLGNKYICEQTFFHSMFICTTKWPIYNLQFIVNMESNLNDDIKIINDALNVFNCYDYILNAIKSAKKTIIITMQWILKLDFLILLNRIQNNGVVVQLITNHSFTDFQEDNLIENIYNIFQKIYLNSKQTICDIFLKYLIRNMNITFLKNHYIHENYIVIDDKTLIATTLNIDVVCDIKAPAIEQCLIIKKQCIIEKILKRIDYIKNIENNKF